MRGLGRRLRQAAVAMALVGAMLAGCTGREIAGNFYRSGWHYCDRNPTECDALGDHPYDPAPP